MTETDIFNAEVDFLSYDASVENIVLRIRDEFRSGDGRFIIQDMIDADQYMQLKNVSIQQKNRDLPTGLNDTMSNARIPSGFLRMNVMQKVNYALGKPPILGVNGPVEDTKDESGNIIKDPLKDQYLAEWTEWLNSDRMQTITRMSTDAIPKGKAPAYVTILDGQLEIEDLEPQQIYPAWADRAHKKLDVAIRDYIEIVYQERQKKIINRLIYWDNKTVYRFIYDGGLKPDPDYPAIDSHMTWKTNADGEQQPDIKISWGKVPIVFLKGSSDELPMLNVIRDSIDSYDKLNSKSVDALLDDIDPAIIFRGFSPMLGTLTEQREILKRTRAAGLPDVNADIHYVQVKPDITAIQQKLEHISKDIRKFGQSVMSQESDLTSNPSGVALKFRYQDLDTYINGFETEMREFLCNQLKYFFDIWLEFKGIGTAEQWKEYNLTFKFDRDMMINVAQDIDDTVKLMATGISQETIDNYNPAVESHEIEQQRRESEQNSGLADMAMQRQTTDGGVA